MATAETGRVAMYTPPALCTDLEREVLRLSAGESKDAAAVRAMLEILGLETSGRRAAQYFTRCGGCLQDAVYMAVGRWLRRNS